MPERRETTDLKITLQSEIDRKLSPIISDTNKEDYRARRITNVRIPLDKFTGAIRNPKSPYKSIVILALEHAKEPDDPAYCEHAAVGHTVFEDAINRFIGQITDSNPRISLQQTPIPVTSPDGKQTRTAFRDILNSDDEIKRLFRPLPIIIGEAVQQSFTLDAQKHRRATFLRRLSIQKGIDLAVVAAVAAGINRDDILDIFSRDKYSGFQIQLPDSFFGKLPKRSRESDYMTISRIQRAIFRDGYISRNVEDQQQAFQEALAAFGTPETTNILKTVKAEFNVRSIAVFSNASIRAAYHLATSRSEIRDPLLNNLTHFYSNFLVTNLVTAYNTYKLTDDSIKAITTIQ